MHRAEGSDSLSLHLPHWITSNKADLNCSGMSSVPDLKYPAWIQRCGLHGITVTRRLYPMVPNQFPPLNMSLSVLPSTAPTVKAPSWVEELEDDDSHQTSQVRADTKKNIQTAAAGNWSCTKSKCSSCTMIA